MKEKQVHEGLILIRLANGKTRTEAEVYEVCVVFPPIDMSKRGSMIE